ncbi:MAG: bifunctional riboflavin kinase/FAD synthetase [Actinomycetota bacterium]
MQVVRDMDWCPRPPEGAIVTVGAYDGIHRGHRAVIGEMHRLAAERGARTAVVTFEPHPAHVVRPESAPRLLTDLDQKLELLRDTGVDYTLVVRFDEERSQESAADFVRSVLVDCLRARAVVVGEDFHFGRNREGDIDMLRRLGGELGFDVNGLSLVQQRDLDETISSTAIRAALGNGDVASARHMLGRHFEIRGTVTSGDRRGRTIGFPTANVPTPPQMQLPADGVYACWYHRPDGTRHPAAVNVGKRPTFYDDAERSLVEAHLVGFRGDVYDEPARVQFVERLRGEQRFDGIDALKAQLARDVERSVEVLETAG